MNTDTWEGFIFVHLDSEPSETLRDYLGGAAGQPDGCPFDTVTGADRGCDFDFMSRPAASVPAAPSVRS